MTKPSKLRPGDKVRFVSPASTPERQTVLRAAEILERWGLRVDYGTHAFDRIGYLAATDDKRLSQSSPFPILGGLPLGHGRAPLSAPLGVAATIDADAQMLFVAPVVEA